MDVHGCLMRFMGSVSFRCTMLQSHKLLRTLSLSSVDRFVSTGLCLFAFPLTRRWFVTKSLHSHGEHGCCEACWTNGCWRSTHVGLAGCSCWIPRSSIGIGSDYPLHFRSTNSWSGRNFLFFADFPAVGLDHQMSHELRRSSATSGTRSNRISKPRSAWEVQVYIQKTIENMFGIFSEVSSYIFVIPLFQHLFQHSFHIHGCWMVIRYHNILQANQLQSVLATRHKQEHQAIRSHSHHRHHRCQVVMGSGFPTHWLMNMKKR